MKPSTEKIRTGLKIIEHNLFFIELYLSNREKLNQTAGLFALLVNIDHIPSLTYTEI